MTIKEAIRILDPETSRGALLPYAYDPDRRLRVVNQACRVACAALRTQQTPSGAHGQWQGEGDGYADGEIVYDVWTCSQCGHIIDDGTDDPDMLPNYCPDCGAKMDGDTAQAPAKLDRSRWKGCKYCNEYGLVVAAFDGWNYCNRCGKPLTEEAWAELERRIIP